MPQNFRIYLVTFISVWVFISPFMLNAKQSKTEFENASHALSQAVVNRDTDFISRNINIEALLQKAFKGIDVSSKFKNEFSQSFTQTAKSQLGAGLLQHVPQDAIIKQVDNQIRPHQADTAFRFDLGENGYAYIRFILRKNAANKVQIVDWYDYSRGQNYSETLATLITSIAPSPGLLGKLEDLANDKKSHRKVTLTLVNLIKQKNYLAVKKVFLEQKTIIGSSWVLSSLVSGASNLSGDMEFYKLALANIAKNFSDDQRAAFTLMDYYIYAEDYPQAIAQMQKISNQFSNQDAAMENMIASVYLLQKKYEPAIAYASKSIKLEPDFEEGYWTLINIYTEQGNFAAAIKFLKQLETDFGYEFSVENFADDEFYKELSQSKAFADWLL
ncbi:tetratricopeptide repeat protein [Aliikangiella sp. IMCC44653]